MRISHLLLILAFAALLPAPLPAEETPTLADAMKLIAQGDYDGAALACYPLAQAQPYDAVPQYWLGRAYYGQRFYRLAADRLGRAVEHDARNHDACLWYARALRNDGRTDDAVTALTVFLKRFPNDNDLTFEFVAACMAAGRTADALAALNALADRDPSPAMRATVESWKHALAANTPPAAAEPKSLLKNNAFEMRYSIAPGLVKPLAVEIEAARKQIGEAFGIEMTGFRICAFTAKSRYAAYSQAVRGGDAAPTANAFTQGNTLAVLLPETWPEEDAACTELTSLLRHEMAHLAVNLRTGGQGVPPWLHEALACHYGGTAGVATGHLPDPLLTLRDLDAAFHSPSITRQEAAYAQVYAMAAVLVHDLGQEKLLALLDRLADGMPLPLAYQQTTGDPLDTFLTNWPKRYATLLPQS